MAFGENNIFLGRDFSAKRIGDISPGTILYGAYGPMTVKSVNHTGTTAPLYKISSPDSYYIVTDNHVLCLIAGGPGITDAIGNDVQMGHIFQLSVEDYLARDDDFRRNVYGWRTAFINPPTVDPGFPAYEEGLILSYRDYMQRLMAKLNLEDCAIPRDYIWNSASIRRSLIAGYADGCGNYAPETGLVLPVYDKKLCWDMYVVAKSLGFDVSYYPDNGLIYINGELSRLPTEILQMPDIPTQYYYNLYVEPFGEGESFEIVCDNQSGYLVLDDFTIVHC